MLKEQEIRSKYHYACNAERRPVAPEIRLFHAACIRYQIILHGSDVASICRFVNAVFACDAGGGSSLRTSNA